MKQQLFSLMHCLSLCCPQVKKKIKPPYPNVDNLFSAATSGRMILRAEDKVALFETQSRQVLNEIQVSYGCHLQLCLQMQHVTRACVAGLVFQVCCVVTRFQLRCTSG
jgi:hypothetical protein